MLIPITDYKQKLTLIQDSGIQFLDFALTPQFDEQRPASFVRQTANGPLMRLTYEPQSDKYWLPANASHPAEVVRPEFSFALSQSLKLLDKVWLPLPFFRLNSSGNFLSGPDNWVRMRVTKLDQPDQDGNEIRVTLAFDTQVYPADHEHAALAPNISDIQSGLGFALAYHSNDLSEFLDQTWIDGWLREIFTQQAGLLEQRSETGINTGLKEFEYQAHYLNLLGMIGNQLSLPSIKISSATELEPAINVDLILDVGNSHTCGILVEEHTDESNGLKQTYELQLRDLDEPQYLHDALFASRMEFMPANFGKQSFSFESGRDDAFIWPSIVRVGDEASRMALLREGTEGSTGISGPRRYLWDDESYAPGWRFNRPGEPIATAAPLTTLINDDGQPLSSLAPNDRLPVFAANYSRSSLMTLMLTELLAQALMQINSAAQRLKMRHSATPRQLRSIILTLPSAMPKPEREIFRQRMQQAIGLVWQARGWYPIDEAFSPEKSIKPVPDVQMEWDEATCGQMVYLYNETQVNFAGRTADFFRSMARPDSTANAGKTLRIASIDIGGGTTDLAITQYSLDDGIGNNVKIVPRLLFREGFKVAGDDILLDIIQLYLLPALQNALKKIGLTDPTLLLEHLFGGEGRIDGFSTLRQQTALQLFIPLAQRILQAYEQFDPLDTRAELAASFGELLAQPPTAKVLAFINHAIQREVKAEFDILQVPLILSLNALHGEFLSNRMTITRNLRSLSEVVALYDCDVLLLTGRPARFPGIQALFRHLQPLPANRILSLEGYHTHDWYPFNQQGRIENPKSTAAVGAMLCLLATNLRLASFYFQAGDFEPYSTIRYFGMLSSDNTLADDNLYYRDIDLDSADFSLPADSGFQMRGSLRLGFRQLDNERWPASPLYTLSIVDVESARKVAANDVLSIRLKIADAERFELVAATLSDGTRLPLHHLQFKLNTLAARSSGASHYWIDSGSVFSQ